MMWQELRKGQRVRDRWWPWHFGIVHEVKKTVALIQHDDGVIVKYDKAHVQFLAREADSE